MSMRSPRWSATAKTGFCLSHLYRFGTAIAHRGTTASSRRLPRSFGVWTRQALRRALRTRCLGLRRIQFDDSPQSLRAVLSSTPSSLQEGCWPSEDMIVSFVIPAYNASGTIDAALRSVYGVHAGASDMGNVEVIVVDDGSNDRGALEEVLGRYPKVVLVTHESNCGMCASRNSGIRRSQGDIVVILDADDVLVSEWPGILRSVGDEWP